MTEPCPVEKAQTSCGVCRQELRTADFTTYQCDHCCDYFHIRCSGVSRCDCWHKYCSDCVIACVSCRRPICARCAKTVQCSRCPNGRARIRLCMSCPHRDTESQCNKCHKPICPEHVRARRSMAFDVTMVKYCTECESSNKDKLFF